MTTPPPDPRLSGAALASHASLRELQERFAAAVYDDATTVLAHIRPGVFSTARHLQVYRNNTFANLTDALAAVYPVVQRLVGDDFFAYAADRFIRRYPPRSGNLHDFGGELPEFIATFEPAAHLVYLPDVARLEWARHEAFHAADVRPLAVSRLAQVPAVRYDELVFALHPSARLLASPYPILRIWEVNQPDFDGDGAVDLHQDGERVLVIRRQLDVTIERVAPGDFELLRCFASAASLGAAFEAALAADPDFDLMRTLQEHVARGTVSDFRLP